MDGININCKKQDFIAEIFNGMKTVETRDTNSLKSHIGQRVYLIRTGCGKAVIVGEATIGEPVHWTSESDFDLDYPLHRVGKDSPYYIHGEKYGYPMLNPVKYDQEYPVTAKGIVIRKNLILPQ